MRRFIRVVLLTLLAGLLLGTATEIIYFQISRSNNPYAIKREYIEKHGDEIKTLVMGSSLFENSLNTDIMGDSIYNLAISGRALYYDAQILEKYLHTMPNVRTVLLPLHYNMTCFYRGHSRSPIGRYYIYNYYHEFGIITPEFSQGIIYRSAIMSGLIKYNARFDNKHLSHTGYDKRVDLWDGNAGEGFPNQQDTAPCIELLTQMAALCDSFGIRLIVVTPPFSNLYISEADPRCISMLDSVANCVAQRHPIEYHNYMCDPEFRDDSLYYNWNHLNHRGATQLAERVKKDFGI